MEDGSHARSPYETRKCLTPGLTITLPPTVVQRSLVGPVGSLLHIFEVGMLLTQPSVENSNPYVSTLFQKESKYSQVWRNDLSGFLSIKHIPPWNP